MEVKLSFLLKHLSPLKITQQDQLEQVVFRMFLDFSPTPARERRVLFDQYHSLKYPENGYVLRDSLLNAEYPYEWNGDHVFTNYVHVHQKLVESGYSVEILTESWSCFNAQNYQVLMIIDPEDYLSKSEIHKLRYDFEKRGLSLIIVADWYN